MGFGLAFSYLTTKNDQEFTRHLQKLFSFTREAKKEDMPKTLCFTLCLTGIKVTYDCAHVLLFSSRRVEELEEIKNMISNVNCY